MQAVHRRARRTRRCRVEEHRRGSRGAASAGIVATSLVFYIPFSLHVTLGQDYLPSRVGTASGVTLGLAVCIGGLAAPLLGVIADQTSLRTAIALLTIMPVVSALVGIGMHEPHVPPSIWRCDDW